MTYQKEEQRIRSLTLEIFNVPMLIVQSPNNHGYPKDHLNSFHNKSWQMALTVICNGVQVFKDFCQSWHNLSGFFWNMSSYGREVPKCFGLVQIFCARPKIYLHIVAVTNILCHKKRWFAFSKTVFYASTKVFEEALNAVKFLGWLKIFGPAQNILGPVKGQGSS